MCSIVLKGLTYICETELAFHPADLLSGRFAKKEPFLSSVTTMVITDYQTDEHVMAMNTEHHKAIRIVMSR